MGTRTDRRYSPGLRMEAIKKKMQAMKVEKDNLCDRCDEVEQKAKEAHIRQEKAEEECTELTNKARTLEIDVEEELKVVANNLKSLGVSEDKANQRESFYKSEIKRLTTKLKQSETRSEFAEKSVVKLQKEVDRLEDELVNEQDKFKAIPEELDATFAEMSGY